MKDKMESIRKRLTEQQAASHGVVADIDALLAEIDAKSEQVTELDTKIERLRVVEGQLSQASQDLLDTQQRKASAEKAISDLRNKLA